MVILFDRFHLSDDVFDTIFATNQQVIVAKLLIDLIKHKNGQLTKPEMSKFATKLHDGEIIAQLDGSPSKKVKVSYNKRQFYDRILTPMKSMGLIEYDLYKKIYRISDKLNKSLIRVGLQWLDEIQRNPKTLINAQH